MKLTDCYAIDGGCALHLKNDQVYKSVVFNDGKNSFLVEKENGKIKETVLSKIIKYIFLYC